MKEKTNKVNTIEEMEQFIDTHENCDLVATKDRLTLT